MALTKLEVTSREAFAGGRSFGEAGAYERIDGIAHFVLAPGAAANAEIVDLALAERGPDGLVHFDSDFTILRPVDGRARRLLVDIPNRGSKIANTFLNRAERVLVPTVEIDPGDGFLFERGWTVAWAGWQWDVANHPALLGLRAPSALENGNPIEGLARVEISCALRRAYSGLRDETLGPSINEPYPAANVADADATMTLQEYPDGPRTLIERHRWRFARQNDEGVVEADNRYVWIEGGFDPGRIYTVTYRTNRCPVVGVGLAAIRDFGSFLRNETDAAANPLAGDLDFAYSFGVSQSGRFLRTLLYHGMNTDEAGRQVFDGIHAHIGGGRRGDFNVRFGMPSVEGATGLGHLPPFADDPVPGVSTGLLDRQRTAGGVPKIVYSNTSSEYWRGDGSFVHTDLAGEDVPLSPQTRVYQFSGTPHGSGVLPFANSNPLSGDTGRHLYNVVDYRPLARAALMNLDRWVSEGTEPPASWYPLRALGTAVSHEEIFPAFAQIPGAFVPASGGIRRVYDWDFGPEAAAGIARHPVGVGEMYVTRVSSVDEDGNETGGIRLPDISSPVATHAGWNPRDPSTGGEGQVLRLAGSTIPFARTAAERAAKGDPRPSITERYGSREGYETSVAKDTDALIAQRYVLAADRVITIAAAMERYDAVMALGER